MWSFRLAKKYNWKKNWVQSSDIKLGGLLFLIYKAGETAGVCKRKHHLKFSWTWLELSASILWSQKNDLLKTLYYYFKIFYTTWENERLPAILMSYEWSQLWVSTITSAWSKSKYKPCKAERTANLRPVR